MKKTYYTVTRAVLGYSNPQTKVFADKAAAWDYYNKHDHIDKPVAHTVSKAESIQRFEDLLLQQATWEGF